MLLNVLDTTGRFVEVAYIAQALDDLAKEHKDAFLKAARELLSGPIVDPTNETPVLDRQNRWLLFELRAATKTSCLSTKPRNSSSGRLPARIVKA